MAGVEPASRIAADVIEVVLAHYRRPEEVVGKIDVVEAVHGLCVAIAMLVEASNEAYRTPKQIREMGDWVGRIVRNQVKLLREEYERKGERDWLVLPETSH